jgi:hypothetical protein
MGHEERFPPARLSAGCGFRKETIAGMRRDGRDAPFADLADRAPHLFEHPIGDVETRCPPAAIFGRTLGRGTLYSGDQMGVVKRVANPGVA